MALTPRTYMAFGLIWQEFVPFSISIWATARQSSILTNGGMEGRYDLQPFVRKSSSISRFKVFFEFYSRFFAKARPEAVLR
jgi:hypothetical protein